MKTQKFMEEIAIKFEKDEKEAEKEINSFVTKNFAKETDTLWEKGAQKMLVGSILYLLKRKQLSVENLKELFVLTKLCNGRQKYVYKKLSKAPQDIQVYFVGIVDSAETTFKGYVGILKSYIDML